MVEINEEESDRNGHSRTAAPLHLAVGFLKQRGSDTVLWILRLVTLIFAVLYVFPIGVNQYSCYQKAHLAAAATNALRLHQRVGSIHFSREFLGRLFIEDSCHYLFYSLIFLNISPITSKTLYLCALLARETFHTINILVALFPVCLFAFLHWCNFTIQLLNVSNLSDSALTSFLNNIVASHSQSILLLIASAEIFLMPMIILMIFMGKCNIFIPFVFHRFLTLRYMSQRNPYSRTAFYQLRIALENGVSNPRCPGIIRRGVESFINFMSRMAPAMHGAPR